MSKRSSKFVLAGLLAGASGLLAPSAHAFPGFFVGKDEQARVSTSTQVVVMQRDQRTVVTVMTDYTGPSQQFAIVMPLPSDVVGNRVTTLKRDFVTRIDQMTAPRFHEFWEMDPCDEEKNEQEWERNLSASDAKDFLGGGLAAPTGPKVAKEMTLTVEPEFKHASEYNIQVLSEADSGNITAWLEKQGYKLPAGAAEAVKPYVDAKQRFLVAVVDQSKTELTGDGRVQLSPIRFWTEQGYNSIPSTLGLLSSDGKPQELVVTVLHPEQRFEAKNYDNVFPPNNLNVEFVVKERMGEFYAGLHDMLLQKNPRGILNEYAWSTKECGQPCPNPPLYIHELLSLGADVFEEALPEAVRKPKAPERSAEEKAAFDALTKPAEKKASDEQRAEVARRKALVERHQYILSRLHHRYDKQSLNQDIQIGAAGHIRGGVDVPKGPEGQLPTDTSAAEQSTLQTRFVHLHPNKIEVKCASPEHSRWGKAPRTYRGLRKIWVAEDLGSRNRKEIVPEKVVNTAVPALGLKGKASAAEAPKASADAGEAPAEAQKKDSGCSVSAAPSSGGAFSALGLLLGGLAWFGRRRRAK